MFNRRKRRSSVPGIELLEERTNFSAGAATPDATVAAPDSNDTGSSSSVALGAAQADVPLGNLTAGSPTNPASQGSVVCPFCNRGVPAQPTNTGVDPVRDSKLVDLLAASHLDANDRGEQNFSTAQDPEGLEENGAGEGESVCSELGDACDDELEGEQPEEEREDEESEELEGDADADSTPATNLFDDSDQEADGGLDGEQPQVPLADSDPLQSSAPLPEPPAIQSQVSSGSVGIDGNEFFEERLDEDFDDEDDDFEEPEMEDKMESQVEPEMQPEMEDEEMPAKTGLMARV